jgi:hypothetical protein
LCLLRFKTLRSRPVVTITLRDLTTILVLKIKHNA